MCGEVQMGRIRGLAQGLGHLSGMLLLKQSAVFATDYLHAFIQSAHSAALYRLLFGANSASLDRTLTLFEANMLCSFE